MLIHIKSGREKRSQKGGRRYAEEKLQKRSLGVYRSGDPAHDLYGPGNFGVAMGSPQSRLTSNRAEMAGGRDKHKR